MLRHWIIANPFVPSAAQVSVDGRGGGAPGDHDVKTRLVRAGREQQKGCINKAVSQARDWDKQNVQGKQNWCSSAWLIWECQPHALRWPSLTWEQILLLIGHRSDAVALLPLESTEEKRGMDKEISKGAVGSGLITICLKGWGRKGGWVLLWEGVSAPVFHRFGVEIS